ncbi:MAG: DUF951 domain-containing protein [Bacilli bacterium]|nr:DUF951 domain-containing protein [Bacilli bacterium]
MVTPDYCLYDVVEMKRPHPCQKRSKQFQIVRVGADIKIRCLGCGNLIMMERAAFNDRVKKVISHNEVLIKIS